MLEIEHLTVRYGRASAVMDVSLRVDRGEVVSLVGPNGAGKTTLLATVAGLLSPAAGEIRFGGREINGRAPERLVRDGLALVPEGRHIFATLTVAENLRLPTADLAQGPANQAIESELERFPALRARLRSPAGSLSGGEQQQLAIARSLLCRPKLLLLDEPSLGLAPKLVDAVFMALSGLRDEGVTVLLVEQKAIRAVELADRTYVMNAGRIVLHGTRAEMADKEKLTTSYLGAGKP